MRRFLIYAGCTALALTAACEREILPLEGFDEGDAGAPDATVEPPTTTQPETDSGISSPAPACTDPDRDGDGICDARDNCPDKVNADQDPSKCATAPTASASCTGLMVPPDSQLVVVATLSNVRIDGKAASSVVNVAKGQSFSLELNTSCGAQGTPIIGPLGGVLNQIIPPSVVVGLEGASVGECSTVDGCTNSDPQGRLTVQLTAPSKPGGYYIVAEAHMELLGVLNSCNESTAGPLVKRIAAICVE